MDGQLYIDPIRPSLPLTKEQIQSFDRLVERRGTPLDVQPMIMGDGCILVQFPGIWIGIEPDGYAHS